MHRDGLIIAGGVIGILRGAYGTFTGLSSMGTVREIESLIPGYTQVFYYELFVSVVILIVAIYALVKSNDASSAGSIKGWGIAIIVAGVLDMVWGIALLGGSAAAIGAGLGSVVALTLIGGLLAAGANRLAKSASAGPALPAPAQ